MGTDSREKGTHFIGSRELNIKRVAVETDLVL